MSTSSGFFVGIIGNFGLGVSKVLAIVFGFDEVPINEARTKNNYSKFRLIRNLQSTLGSAAGIGELKKLVSSSEPVKKYFFNQKPRKTLQNVTLNIKSHNVIHN